MEANIKPKKVREYIEDLVLMLEATKSAFPIMDLEEKANCFETIINSESYKILKEFISETY